MSRKNKIIISVTGIILVLVTLIGLTYAYYLTRINGNTNDKSVTVSLANLELTYSDGNGLIEATNIVPGEVIATKTFSVENTGDKKVINYTVYLDDVINTFENKNDVKLTLTCTSSKGNKCTGTEITYPSTDTLLSINDIEVEEKHNYELKVEFIETNTDQSIDMNKELSGNIIIRDLKGTGSEITNTKGTNSVSVDNAKLLSNYRIYGNSVQGGTPTPDNPVEIESVGDLVTDTSDSNNGKYKIGIKTTGKNLITAKELYGSLLTGTSSSYSEIVFNQKNSIKFVDNSTKKYTKIKFKEKTSYTVSFDYAQSISSNGAPQHTATLFVFYYTDGTSDGLTVTNASDSVDWKHVSLTSNSSKTISSIGTASYNYRYFNYIDVDTFQLEEGSSATDYEPYNEETTNIYLTEPLRKIENYTDYIDFKSGKVVRNIYEGILDGTVNWNLGGTISNDYQTFYTRKYLEKALNGNRNCLSDKFKNIVDVSLWNAPNPYLIQTGGSDRVCYVTLPKSVASDITQAKQFFNENNSKYYFILNSQTEETVSLPNIDLNKVKYINIESDINPSSIELNYIK